MTPQIRQRMTVQGEAHLLAARMQRAIAGLETFQEWAPVVIATARGCGGPVFMCYDDAGGNVHSWAKQDFYKVRQVRNNPRDGRLLYDAVNAKR